MRKDIETLDAVGIQAFMVIIVLCIALIYSVIAGVFDTVTQIVIIFFLLIQSQIIILVKLLIDREMEKRNER